MASNLLKANERIRPQYKTYSQDVKEIAVQAVAEGRTTCYKAEQCYGVPAATIRRVVNGSHAVDVKMGPKTVLSMEQENKLAK